MKRAFAIVIVVLCSWGTYAGIARVYAATQTLPAVTATLQAGLRINEIMYNPPGEIAGGKNLEWVELYNQSQISITIIGGVQENAWTISDSAGTHYFAKTPYQGSMSVMQNSYAIIAGDARAFKDRYPLFQGTIIDVGIRLRNDQDVLQLHDGTGKIISQVFWSNTWGAAGNGKTLEYSTADKAFREGLRPDGSPGLENSVEGLSLPPIPSINPGVTAQPTPFSNPQPQTQKKTELTINELFTSPENKGTQWIEIKNDGTTIANLANWQIIIASFKKPIQLSGTLLPLSYKIIDSRDYNFIINKQGDTIALVDPTGLKTFEVTYASAIPSDWSASRFGRSEWKLSSNPTPGTDNIFALKETTKQETIAEVIPPFSLAASYQPTYNPSWKQRIYAFFGQPKTIVWGTGYGILAAYIFLVAKRKYTF
ncbi:MAG: hypothetical protein COV41_02715 [Candidatus Brennerbacteria bacterium CG11_big_fil_rev_8_21_14_0_20_43_10]|uniref:LTD domain-containing protein n=2 Tax=Candidatus Brenneribacteriota TaxID=1817902 RepID=A0A2H9N540_9BACT|nr:MAG: hypothetical protein AUJ43_00160 [Parcubacteria group bacterium CG1_02_44_31]PIP50544.1 MAG: hypothetical protein COX12_00750 [Candidatus Brennerbacteria bacterium CG23_combo_of_CG06-09_8_20_14_all_44_41]PIR25777.1 MAG: hypothetical protein COV41_02715 [Candidatus Brennerbacteria bacterium CG11_big_fil_rev_8_21_14_0_20_43_10]PIX28963.1 MAG: hypothetical protein COZ64_01445 [Candidatus Brennerbacteria bacterium CG_4_8_14_3_um_filter_43_14]PJA19221.1 MAG: hypothetical protein COX61_01750 